MKLSLDDGIDFTQDEVAEALLEYATKRGATITADPSDIVVMKTGSRLRREGVFLVIKRAKSEGNGYTPPMTGHTLDPNT